MLDLTVIIPFYNTGDYILEAIESVESYKGSHTYEIIIINDGSQEEHSIDVLKKLKSLDRYIILDQKNQGPAAARNKGLEKAKGEFILFLDSDNRISPEYIDYGVNELRKHCDAAVVYSKREMFGSVVRSIPETKDFDIEEIIISNYIDMCAIVRKEALDKVGGFTVDKNLTSCEDWELWIKIYSKGWHFIFIPKVLFYYRIRKGSISEKEDKNYRRSVNFIADKNGIILYDLYAKKSYELARLQKIVNYENDHPIRTFFKRIYHLILK